MTFDLCSVSQCVEFGEGSVTGDMCEDLCVLGLVEYKRCLYYENGKKVIEARWRGKPVILKSKLENFSSYEPLGMLDYQVMLAPRVASFREAQLVLKYFSSFPRLHRTQQRSSPRLMLCFMPLWR